uniref:Universal stress protein n=1 Tax=Coriandrum sativum TaxID=4047 RepID=A0A7D5YQ59_CORSA|nr:universal stress protein [Coriandrum sativum]
MAGTRESEIKAAATSASTEAPTRVMMGVNESTIKGYPHASISSKGAFEWTLNKIIRSNFSGFKLLFLHVQVPDEDGFDDVDSIYASPEDFRRVKRRDKIRGHDLLEYFVKRCHEIGVACEAWIKRGDPKEVICHEVKRVQPDLLVVGSRGLGPFQRVFVGTVSEFCAKHAECPVVTIKRSAEETPQDPVDD